MMAAVISVESQKAIWEKDIETQHPKAELYEQSFPEAEQSDDPEKEFPQHYWTVACVSTKARPQEHNRYVGIFNNLTGRSVVFGYAKPLNFNMVRFCKENGL